MAVFRVSGVSNDKHVVLYGGGAAHIAARAFVTLEYLGHPRVSVMDGGIQAWAHEGRPTVSEAGNIYFVELLESEELPRLKPRNEAEALFVAAGAEPGDTIVSYCQIGMRASYNYLIARHLGYEVKFYDASWQEWGADESLPAQTGSGR